MATKKTAFTKEAFMSETPSWANWLFRITFILTSAFTFYVAGTNVFDESVKYEIMLAIKSIDAVIYGFSRMFGITIEKE